MKVVITARNYSVGESRGIQILKNAGFEVENYESLNLGVGTDEEKLYELVKDADFVIAGLEPYRNSVLSRCRNLKLISRRGIGYDSVDIESCREHSIAVCRTLGAVEGSVAEHVMAYILYFSRRVDLQNSYMQNGKWNRIMMPGAKKKTLGLIGFGGIGQEIAKRAVPFGMNVIYNCRHPKKEWEQKFQVSYRTFDQLLEESDFISINVPLTKDTNLMFSEEVLNRMKKGSILINIARSPVVDVEALKQALQSGHLAGAAIDVFPKEPCTDSPLIGCENVILTPHTAPYTDENFVTMNDLSAQNVVDFVRGTIRPDFLI